MTQSLAYPQDVQEFITFFENTRMNYSYKPVCLLVLLQHADENGQVPKDRFIKVFRQFYVDRMNSGLPVEYDEDTVPSRMLHPLDITEAQIWHVVTANPFPRFGQYIVWDDEQAGIAPNIWRQLTAPAIGKLRQIALNRIEDYYRRIDG